MTGNELLETVCQMGFANALEEGKQYFYRAANLSLSRICRTFPLSGSISICPKAGEEYDVAQEAEDFLGFPASPIFGEAVVGKTGGTFFLREGKDYLVNGSSICFFKDAGPLRIRYLRRPTALTEDNKDSPLDIHPAAETLLPLLTASYLWLDDRGDLATHYLALYHTESRELLNTLHRHAPIRAETNGWDKG